MSLRFDLVGSRDLNPDEWRGLQSLSHDAFGEELKNRSPAEIDYLTAWTDPDRFYESHVHPNSEVGERYNPNQTFARPRVALALDGNDTIGYGYAADNVSGNTFERALKLLGTTKKYLWLKEFAVHPEYQRKGIAEHMARVLLMSGSPFQPMTAYIWPDEIPFLSTPLQKAGFEPTGEQSVKIYGPDSEPVRQVRMLSRSVGSTVLKLAK
ncbi:MAG TPA: GNAT family N-acetyltransferase [Candidatus Saccharimonadales bacterium]|jgi:GNAT superfamily N-acetyltransferase|nr:GNAT family N-acetyltransferase [Candidatus Saccharimonadales bacterium]